MAEDIEPYPVVCVCVCVCVCKWCGLLRASELVEVAYCGPADGVFAPESELRLVCGLLLPPAEGECSSSAMTPARLRDSADEELDRGAWSTTSYLCLWC